jgi:glycerophosphoryl diester phosphodiesterase
MTRPFLLQGHRGARGLFPENTLEGFLATRAIGVDSIELDVAVTADGVPIISHDAVLHADLTRGPDGAWIAEPGPVICNLTLAETARFDVGRLRPGSRTAGLFPDQRPSDGARMPTLAAVFRALPGLRIDAELKTLPDRPQLTVTPAAMANAVVATAAACGALDNLVVRSFDWRGLAYLRQTHPDLPLVWLTSAREALEPGLWWDMPGFSGTTPQAVANAAGRPGSWRPAWAPQFRDFTEHDLHLAHDLGLDVLPWTVNTRADMDRLISWGVDGLCTDRPDIARAAMAAAGLALPAAG